MTRDDPPAYLSGDLRICPGLGQVTSATGGSIRLGPVNMKVLEALVVQAGRVVSRTEIYDTVWGNQVVGEDALTRCISDIRAELRSLSDREDWIETLPKRGYRWTGDVREAGPDKGPVGTPAPTVPQPQASVRTPPGPAAGGRTLRLVGRGALYLVALVAMGSLVVWSIDRIAGRRAPAVAVLPLAAEPGQNELAAHLGLELTGYLMGLDEVRVLSRSAVESRPANPFPFFYYEFGARWLIEGEVQPMSQHALLTLSVVDARTGIVEWQVTELISDIDSGSDRVPVHAFSSLSQFIESERSR